MRPGRAVVLSAVLLLAGAAGLSACGGSGSAPNGVAAESAGQIVGSAAKAMRAASSVEMKGVLDGYTVNIFLYQNGDVSGTLAKSGLSFDLIELSHASYVKAGAAFWQQAGSASPADAAKLANRWIELPAGDRISTAGVSLSSLAGALQHGNAKLTKIGTKTINGERVVGVHSSKNGTLWVAATGTSYPVALSGPVGRGNLTLTDWNQSSPPSAPSNAVPLASILG